MAKIGKQGGLDISLDRRRFLQWGGALASLASVSSVLGTRRLAALVFSQNPPDPPEGTAGVEFKFSVCQMCHGRCGIMCKIKDGVLLKIDGNPYHPNNMHDDERLPYATAVATAVRTRGRLCLKGQSGVQTLYDPYRIKQPLKRVGPRGSGQWQAISWDDALSEIANKLVSLRDFVNDAKPGRSKAGKAVNKVLFAPGRTIEGEFTDRIWKDGYGTYNYRLDHTSICEVDHHVAYELATWDKAAATPAGRKNHFKPELLGCEYAIFFGSNPLEANFAMVPLARNLMEMKKRGGKYVVVDPRFSNAAAQADQWVPIIPGTDAALALGMARWIVDNGRHDTVYLSNANKAAATADGETTWTDATWLVITEPADANAGKYMRANEIGGAATNFVAWNGAAGVEVISQSTTAPVDGVLDTEEVIVNGKRCKSAFTLFRERIQQKTLAEYSAICGVSEATITQLANDFTAHGKKAATEHYRGVVQHTNGAYSSLAIMALDFLIGNCDWKGGSTAGGGGWSFTNATGGVNVQTVPGGVAASGVRIDRTKGKTYENQGSEYLAADDYPAQRPWFPYATHGNFQEVIPSAAHGYPYEAKALITYWNAWPYSTPALRNVFETYIADETKCELFVAISVNIGEVAAWADYILPDTTYLEKFAFTGGTPSVITKLTAFQQPVVGTFDGSMNYTPVLPQTKMYIDILIELGKKMGIPGVGAGAFADGGSLDRAWDFVQRALNNLSISSGKSVADIQAKGGAFEDPGNEYDSGNPNKQKNRYGNEFHFYIEELAVTKDSMSPTAQKFDPMAKYEVPSHADGTPVDDGPGYPFRLITYKSVRHGQARTAANPWLMALQPENFVDISSADAAALGVETGEKVKITSVSNPAGIVGKAWVTEGLRPGVIAVSHHFGHWELGSRAHVIDGVTQPHDPSRGAGTMPNLVMRLDDAISAANPAAKVSLQSKIGGSVSFYDTRVNVVKA
ncbi:MAG: molybdopterin-dependent oxidoreductase [Deltaproteobacteria bacterium]|nr:molybdopterin-dependent oxidoreductase [Deltaproteobacteria bacterium]